MTKVRENNSTAGNTLPMPWPARPPMISPVMTGTPDTTAPIQSGRPSARLARANRATMIARPGSNGGWSAQLNMVRIQAPVAAVTTMATVAGARNRQHSGTVTSSRNAACTATGPGNVTVPPSEDRLPCCARSTAPSATMASGTSHQETADHSRKARSMAATYAAAADPASPRWRSPGGRASPGKRSRAAADPPPGGPAKRPQAEAVRAARSVACRSDREAAPGTRHDQGADMFRHGMRIAAGVLAAAGAGVAIVAAAPASASGQTISYTETETSNHSFNLGSGHGVAVGFIQLSGNKLMRGGTQIGHDGGNCTVTRLGGGTADELCTVVAVLTAGQIDLAGLVTSTPQGPGTFQIAVTGGTGSYAGARGYATVVSGQRPRVTIHLTG